MYNEVSPFSDLNIVKCCHQNLTIKHCLKQCFIHEQLLLVPHPERFASYEPTGVDITDIETTAFTQNPESLTLTWQPKHLQHVFEAEAPATVDITLFAYRENPDTVVETGAAKVWICFGDL